MRRMIEVYNPYDETIVDSVPESTLEDVEKALEKLEIGKKIMQSLPLHKRVEILSNTAKIIEENSEDLAITLVKEVGKTIREARIEVRRTAEIFKLASEEAKRIHGETLPFDSVKNSENKIGFFIRVPVGIIAAITPFNVPLALAAHKIAPAIAGGNCVIFKPSTLTPLADIKLSQFLYEAGLPEEALKVVLGPGETIGEAIIKDDRVRMISFTGSREVGLNITRKAGIKKISLELGSNSALILSDKGDVKSCAKATVKGGYAVAGQVCISIQRVLVHKKVLEEFLHYFIPLVENLRVGNPMREDTDMGPMITESAAKRVEEWIKEALNLGGKILTGGEREKTLLKPTVLIDVPLEAKVIKEEVFGPVVTIIPFENVEEAINDAITKALNSLEKERVEREEYEKKIKR
ncbi:MAG: aldehyde dehydrogenase family protein, partial [Dictyoglomus sp.]